MVTAAQVWEALAEIPDPEIPVVSLVDLGVVRDVSVEDRRVRIEFTPTFLGCPALEVMRSAMAARLAELGAEPEIEVVLDDSWSTDRITPEGRERLREAVEELWPYALGVLDDELRPVWIERIRERLGFELLEVEPITREQHTEELRELWEEMTSVRRSVPSGASW